MYRLHGIQAMLGVIIEQWLAVENDTRSIDSALCTIREHQLLTI
jgi:hypothetical protein